MKITVFLHKIAAMLYINIYLIFHDNLRIFIDFKQNNTSRIKVA